MYARKRAAWDSLRGMLSCSFCGGLLHVLWHVDARLSEYVGSLASDAWDDGRDCNTRHNYYEICGGLRFVRLYQYYEFDASKVRRVISLREGTWEKDDNGMWRHVSGGIPQPTASGKTFFRWEPFQVFVLASVFGFYCEVDTGVSAGARALGPTERLVGSRIYDRRRLCTNFTLFAPRKVDKTGMSAYVQLVFFLMEDYNSEIYCCANSADQSKTLYSRTRAMVEYLNRPHRFHVTATVCDWEAKYRNVRNSAIVPLTAGGKTKDGLQAQLCCADEYGSAAWVKNHSDMKSLVDVIESSMGPRREPLTFITTTAGTITDGPFVQVLEGLHRMLEEEGKSGMGAARLRQARGLGAAQDGGDDVKDPAVVVLAGHVVLRDGLVVDGGDDLAGPQRRERLHHTQKRPGQECIPVFRRLIDFFRARPCRKPHRNRLFQRPADEAP